MDREGKSGSSCGGRAGAPTPLTGTCVPSSSTVSEACQETENLPRKFGHFGFPLLRPAAAGFLNIEFGLQPTGDALKGQKSVAGGNAPGTPAKYLADPEGVAQAFGPGAPRAGGWRIRAGAFCRHVCAPLQHRAADVGFEKDVKIVETNSTTHLESTKPVKNELKTNPKRTPNAGDSTLAGSAWVEMLASGGVAPGYFTNPLRGFAGSKNRPLMPETRDL